MDTSAKAKAKKGSDSQMQQQENNSDHIGSDDVNNSIGTHASSHYRSDKQSNREEKEIDAKTPSSLSSFLPGAIPTKVPSSQVSDTNTSRDQDVEQQLRERLMRFKTQGYKDWWATILFVIIVLCTFVGGVSNIFTYKRKYIYKDITLPDGTILEGGPGVAAFANGLTFQHLILTTIGACILSILLCIVTCAAVFMKTYKALLGCAVVATVECIVAAIICFLKFDFGGIVLGVLLVLGSIVPVVWMYMGKAYISLSASFLRTGTESIKSSGKLIFIADIVVVSLLLVYINLLWVPLVFPVVDRLAVGEEKMLDYLWLPLSIIMLLWVGEVLTHVMTLFVCGLTSLWYYAEGMTVPEAMRRNCLKKTLTTSFGSVCVASTFEWFVQTFYTIASRGSTSEASVIFTPCARCIESLVTYFNHYALVNVAVQGCGYTQAAKESWARVQMCLLASFFDQDCLVGPAFAFISLGNAILIGIYVSCASGSESFAWLTAWITLVVHFILLTPLKSSVRTIFVCYAEYPDSIQESAPDLAGELHTQNV